MLNGDELGCYKRRFIVNSKPRTGLFVFVPEQKVLALPGFVRDIEHDRGPRS